MSYRAGFSGGRSLGPPPLAVGPFADNIWYAGSVGGYPPWTTYTVEGLVYIGTIPTTGQTQIIATTFNGSGGGGFSIFANENGLGAAVITDAGLQFAPYLPLDGCAGKSLVFSLVCQGAGGAIRLYVNECEVGFGTNISGTPHPTPNDTALQIGVNLFFPGSGLSGTSIRLAYLSIGDQAQSRMTIVTRHRQIMRSTRGISFPDMPSSGPANRLRYLGSNAGVTWVDSYGNSNLVRSGVPAVSSLMIDWVKNLGNITTAGDSTYAGLLGIAGGFQITLGPALTALGYRYTMLGSRTPGAGIGSFGVSGVGYDAFRNGGSNPLTTELISYSTSTLVLGIGWNNIRGTIGLSTATFQTNIIALLDEVFAATPWVRVVLAQFLPTLPGDIAAWPLADNTACNARITEINTITLPAIAAHFQALGFYVEVVTDPYLAITRGDSIHPDDLPTGYPRMATPMVPAIQRVKPA